MDMAYHPARLAKFDSKYTDTQIYVKKEYGSVGIVNTHQRLLQHFGDEYSFYMDSVPQKGTTVAIHLPRIL